MKAAESYSSFIHFIHSNAMFNGPLGRSRRGEKSWSMQQQQALSNYSHNNCTEHSTYLIFCEI